MRKLRMLLTLLLVSVCSWQDAWAQEEEEEVVVSVSLAQAGELGIEILRLHDPITEVTDLTVRGTMNDEDWATLQNMTALKYLDLYDVTNESMPDYLFSKSAVVASYAYNLISVKLPQYLKKIGGYAFSKHEQLTDVYIPSTLEELGSNAFANCVNLENLHITDLPTSQLTSATGT